jgi:hypothetical protein
MRTMPPDVWLEPLGIISLMVEAAFIVLFVQSRQGAGPRDRSSASGALT